MNNLKNIFTLPNGQILYNIHSAKECTGKYCVIHNPSNHHMKDWPLIWREDRGIFERICPCGVGHPDPDALKHEVEYEEDTSARIHGCCGHCDPNYKKGI
jgi:hypothetical protein